MRILRPEEVQTFPPFREYSPEELQQAYALAKEAFSVEDLLRYVAIEEDIPAEIVLQELEQAQAHADEKMP